MKEINDDLIMVEGPQEVVRQENRSWLEESKPSARLAVGQVLPQGCTVTDH